MTDILERDGLSVDLLSSLSYWGGELADALSGC